MKAVVMAGGEGSRLRPLTLVRPKPMLPVVNRPVLGHILYLLKQHGITDVVMTVQYLAAQIQDYYGDGRALGMNIEYVVEESPLGHGRQREERGRPCSANDEPFLVISGDALTDFDLTASRRRAIKRRARPCTMALYPRAQPARIRRHQRRRRRARRAVPGEAELGRGHLRHGQHRHLRDRARSARAASRRAPGLTGARMFSPACWHGRAALRLRRRWLLVRHRHAAGIPPGQRRSSERPAQPGRPGRAHRAGHLDAAARSRSHRMRSCSARSTWAKRSRSSGAWSSKARR